MLKSGRRQWSPSVSARPYLSVLTVGMVLGLWAGYLWPGRAIVFGQSPAVIIPFVGFALVETSTNGGSSWAQLDVLVDDVTFPILDEDAFIVREV